MNFKHALILLSLSGGASLVLARLPEPCNLYYGEVVGPQGLSLTGTIVIARIGGTECARSSIRGFDTSNVNYVVRIPLDDGFDLRYDDAAARTGERPSFSVVCDGTEFPVETLPPVIGARGSSHRFDFDVIPEPFWVPQVLAVIAAFIRARRR